MSKRKNSLRQSGARASAGNAGSILILASGLLVLALPMSSASASGEKWNCVAYGYGGAKNVWRTVNGKPAADQAEAIKNAAEKCYREGLRVCEPNGCTLH